ncbi:MAG TPA: NADH-quinone oxidoreductase subunit NuoG [Acidimicrobiales bacterium]
MADTSTDALSIVVDGRQVEASRGEMVIAAAERAGTYIPRFCYHPRMRSVGMCRMCLVEIRGPRGYSLQPACFVAVADGQEIRTTSDKVKKAQDGVLEFLLINHPLDCPVCDKGGECPLQDQTLTYGPGESRFVEEKRHFAKPIPISSLVDLDRERCIQCDRCTRFATEVAGEPLINFIGRGDHIQVNTYPDHPFASYFSGNTVQICPVGALTAAPYRFKARPWDLEQVESTCTSCAVGCRVVVQSSSNRLTRYLGVDSDPVNQSWLCDKGRFDFEAVNSEDRLTHPLVRKGDELAEVSWDEALAAAAEGLAGAKERGGPQSIGVIGGARLPNEDAYTWAKLAKAVIGTDSVDAQLGDGLPAEVVLGLPRATIDQACSADALVLLAPDVREELPVLHLRLREAAVERGVPVIELTALPTGMTRYATVSLTYRPGEVAALARALVAPESTDDSELEAARGVIRGASGADGSGIVVVLGRPSVAESDDMVDEAAAAMFGAWPEARFLTALRRANVHGALDMGLAPGILPGRVGLDEGRAWYTAAWGTVPEERGLDTAGMLSAAVEQRVEAMVLLGADPLRDFPDRQLAERGMAAARFVVAVDAFLNESSGQADVVLPAAVYAERPGTTTNLEGRISRLGQKLVGPGVTRPDWMIAAELAARLGGDLGTDTLEAIWDEIERVAPSHVGITRHLIGERRAADGIVAPIPSVPVRLEVGTGHPGGAPPVHSGANDTGAGSTQPVPGPIDPMATPGIGGIESQGIPNIAGAPRTTDAPDGTDDAHTAMERPPLLRFTPAKPRSVPPPDGYALRLVTRRRLYDQGTLVQSCPSLADLAPAPALRANPYDLDRLGVQTGGRVRVRTGRTLEMGVLADSDVPRGVAVVDLDLAEEGAEDLVDSGRAVTDVRLETI